MTNKPSYKTLEFWMAVAAQVVSIALFIGGAVIENPDSSMFMKVAGAIGSLLSGLGYGVLRTSQKKNELVAEVAKAVGTPPANP